MFQGWAGKWSQKSQQNYRSKFPHSKRENTLQSWKARALNSDRFGKPTHSSQAQILDPTKYLTYDRIKSMPRGPMAWVRFPNVVRRACAKCGYMPTPRHGKSLGLPIPPLFQVLQNRLCIIFLRFTVLLKRPEKSQNSFVPKIARQ